MFDGLKPYLSFRRTLVGLKQTRSDRATPTARFQTNPCGIEARDRGNASFLPHGFRRTLVGLKRARTGQAKMGREGFRRTLVGLKRLELVDQLGEFLVSDEPLWD